MTSGRVGAARVVAPTARPAQNGAMQALVVVGAGGHGRALIELLRDHGGFVLAGVVDARPPATPVLGLAVLGDEGALPGLFAAGVRHACVAIGEPAARLAVAARLVQIGFALPALLHPSVVRAGSAGVDEGAVVLPRAVLGAACRIGRLAIVNTGAIVEHDCVVGEGAHCGPGAVLCGGVRVGDRALIGAGATLRPGVTVGADAVVGLGAAVTDPVPEGGRVGGVPARLLG